MIVQQRKATIQATWLIIPVLGLVGIGISSYLTYVHYREISSVCLFNANCDAVLTSPYSQIWGVPLSLLGLVIYGVLTALGLMLWGETGRRRHFISLALYVVALSGTLFSLYLYYLEIFEIHDFCTWCIGSSLVMFAILAMTVANLLRLKPPPEKG